MDVHSVYNRVKAKYSIPFDLKEEQYQIISSLLEKKSVFAILPTGYGKSNCFIIPPLMLDEVSPYAKNGKHVALVVSPLRSLMKNQVQNINALGIKACAVLPVSEMSKEDVDGIKKGEFSVVFISPESLNIKMWKDVIMTPLYRKRICLVACDEAHCIAQWGLDFRPQYRNVSVLRSICSWCPFVLLTATCTEKMKADILDCLLFDESSVKTIAVVPDRPNIFLNFKSEASMTFEKELDWLVKELNNKTERTPKTVIYCRSLNDAANIYEHLMVSLGDTAWVGEQATENRIIDMYHSQISEGCEERILASFPRPDSKIRCVVSTIAFGMGVQVPDIVNVIHWGVSKNILSYVQEIGRCARDGRDGQAYLYAFLRSLDKRRTDVDMRELCQSIKKEKKCIRLNLLSQLTIRGMDLSHINWLKLRQGCTQSCDSCTCHLCTCCQFCKERCPCN